MEFRETQPIYLQIVDYVCEKVLRREWLPDQRIPSVRELAILLEVNPNTVMRSYEFLQQHKIIYTLRGVGLFVSSGARQTSMSYLKNQFIEKQLPSLIRTMELLNIDADELEIMFKRQRKSAS
jgi:GntR family transcriptional regulator